jgi:hypothetical protein
MLISYGWDIFILLAHSSFILGLDMMIHISPATDLMVFLAPPLEILFSPVLEKFLFLTH